VDLVGRHTCGSATHSAGADTGHRIQPGPAARRRRARAAGPPACALGGYFAQIPHYISGEYAPAALALIEALARHLEVDIAAGALRAEAEQLRTRLDTATALDEKTRAYVERLEEMVDEARLPAGDELISEIERFLRERGEEPGHGQVH